MAKGFVFLISAGAAERVRLLVDHLVDAGIDVVPEWDLEDVPGWIDEETTATAASGVVMAFGDGQASSRAEPWAVAALSAGALGREVAAERCHPSFIRQARCNRPQ